MAGGHDVIVVGGGVFGASAALTLSERGARVLLVDPGSLPHPRAASTDISKVIRMDYGADEFYMRTMERALQAWRGWNADWPEPLYHESGFLLLTSEALREGTFEGDSLALLEQRGHSPERLDGAEISVRFPAWSEAGFVDGYFNPEAGWAQAAQVVSSLVERARALGAELKQGARVHSLAVDGSEVVGVETNQGSLSGDHVVLAAGAWTPDLLPALEGKVWPVAQPVVHLQTERLEMFQPPQFCVWAADISATGWYGFPALDDGTVKIANHGPGRKVGPDEAREVEPEQVEAFRGFLRQSLPALAPAPLSASRLCFYADSWDGDFYLDRVPGYEGLSVATGGSGHAFKFAPLLGEWIADVVQGRHNPELARFAWRAAGERHTEDARYEHRK